jgi:hypothetical protein
MDNYKVDKNYFDDDNIFGFNIGLGFEHILFNSFKYQITVNYEYNKQPGGNIITPRFETKGFLINTCIFY